MTTTSKLRPEDRRKAKQKLKRLGVKNPTDKDIDALIGFNRDTSDQIVIGDNLVMKVVARTDELSYLQNVNYE